MKHRYRSLMTEGLVAAVIFSGPLAFAQTFSWEECVRLAVQNNPAISAAQANLASAENQVSAARSPYFPQLSGALGYTFANSASLTGSPNIVVGAPTQSSGSSSYTLSLNLTQNLFNGLGDYAKIQQAQASAGVARAALQTAKAQLSYNLKTAFEGVDYAQKYVQLTREISGRRSQNLKMVELRFQDGRENKGSVLLYRAYYRDSKLGELQARDAVRTAKSQLAQALGLDEFDELEIAGGVPVVPPPESLDLRHLALQTPNYQTALSQENSAEAGVTLARAGFFPTLGVTGNVGRTGDWFPQNDHWSFGANLTFPLFNGGHDYYGTRAAVETRAGSARTLNDTGHQALVALQQAHNTYREAVEKLNVDTAYLEAAKVRAEIARADYSNGLMSFQDWDLAETDLINRQRNFLQSQQARVTAEAAWEQAQGRGVIP